MSASGDTMAGPRFDWRGRRRVSVAELAGCLDHRLHLPDVDEEVLREGCQLASGLGLAAVTCRPEDVAAAASHLEGSSVGVVTGLAFHRPCATPVSERELVDEARALAEQGATELAVVANAQRLDDAGPDGRGVSFLDAVTRLVSLQHTDGFRLRVHLEPSGLTPERVADVCISFAEAGVWMVQAGTWEGGRASYRLLAPMREALDGRPMLKWTTPLTSHHVMLTAMGVGVDRFNAANPVNLLRDAERQAQSGPLLVPLPGLDYATGRSPGHRL